MLMAFLVIFLIGMLFYLMGNRQLQFLIFCHFVISVTNFTVFLTALVAFGSFRFNKFIHNFSMHVYYSILYVVHKTWHFTVDDHSNSSTDLTNN